jgi:hypothetical protein
VIDPPSLPYAAWPPKDKFREMNVSRGGWDWGSAAVSHGIFDPLDLIHFNFGTTTFGEVNWYLWQYVGCVNSTDGKNFTFAGADPGIIYIPQFGYTRKSPGLTVVEQNALRELRAALSFYPDFWHKGVHFSPGSLKILIQKLENNKIDIIWDTTEDKEESGHWSFKESAITLVSTDFYTDQGVATLIHEATHALLDILTAQHPSVRHYRNIDDEVSAYFADAYWYADSWGLDHVETDIYEADKADIHTSARYLAYIAITQGERPLVLQSLNDHYENTIEKSTMIFGRVVPKKAKPVFPDPFNPYESLRDAIKRSPTYNKKVRLKNGTVVPYWMVPRRVRGMPGK